MYIKYSDYTEGIEEGDSVLMSAEEFVNGGKNLVNVPVTITPYGEEPEEEVEEYD